MHMLAIGSPSTLTLLIILKPISQFKYLSNNLFGQSKTVFSDKWGEMLIFFTQNNHRL